MPTPPFTDGDEIREGRIYRRILADHGHFDKDASKPTYLAFRPRLRDDGAISALLKGYVSEDEAATNPRRPNDRTFGLCEIDIAQARAATDGRFVVRYAPTAGKLGHAHVRAFGCNDVEIAITIAELAEVIRRPKL